MVKLVCDKFDKNPLTKCKVALTFWPWNQITNLTKNPFTKCEVALTFDPEIKSLHRWVQLEPNTFMSRQFVTASLMKFFLPWAEIWAHFSQFFFEQDCRFLSDLMKIPEGISQLWCLPSIRLQWPLLPKIRMSSSLSQSCHLWQICTNLLRDCSKPLKDCELYCNDLWPLNQMFSSNSWILGHVITKTNLRNL